MRVSLSGRRHGHGVSGTPVTPVDRARALLWEHLNPRQRAALQYGAFEVRSRDGRRVWLVIDRPLPNVVLLAGRFSWRTRWQNRRARGCRAGWGFCAFVPGTPNADSMLAQMLMLGDRTGELEFVATACRYPPSEMACRIPRFWWSWLR